MTDKNDINDMFRNLVNQRAEKTAQKRIDAFADAWGDPKRVTRRKVYSWYNHQTKMHPAIYGMFLTYETNAEMIEEFNARLT